MKQTLTIFSILFICIQGTQAQQTYTLDSTVLTSRVVTGGLDIPWEIIWGPDDHIWATERSGRISRINPTTGTQQELLNIGSQIYLFSEAGLLGMVLHPDFSNYPYVYIVYNYNPGSAVRERLVKYEIMGTVLRQ